MAACAMVRFYQWQNPAMSLDFWQRRRERPPRDCYWCEHWGGPIDAQDPDGPIACRDSGLVNPLPRDGCAFWLRAVGVDEVPAS